MESNSNNNSHIQEVPDQMTVVQATDWYTKLGRKELTE